MEETDMVIDQLIEQIQQKQNPCIAGIDPDWRKIPDCCKTAISPADSVARWAMDVIDAIADVVPAVKPQAAFFEVFGSDGFRALERTVAHAHRRDLIVIDDSKRGDIGSTSEAYARAHLAPDGPINADFMTVSPFLGPDSLAPFMTAAARWGKGLFILVKTSNPGSAELSESIHSSGQKLSRWLGDYVRTAGHDLRGKHGYSSIGAVVGATFPGEAAHLRKLMPDSFFLVPGFGAQGGSADDALPCFNPDGLGAVVSSSRGVLYPHLTSPDFSGTESAYLDLVRTQALIMRDSMRSALDNQR